MKIQFAALMSSAFLLNTMASAESQYGLGLEIQSVTTKSSEASELDKKGFGGAGFLNYAYHLPVGLIGTVGLGFQAREVRSSSGIRKQRVASNTGVLSLDLRWALSSFEFGPLLRFSNGKTSTLRADDENNTIAVTDLGAIFAYRFRAENADKVAYLAFTQDLNIARELNTTIMLGFQYWMKTESSSQGQAEPAVPASLSETAKEPALESAAYPTSEDKAETEPVRLRFKSDLFQFKPKTAEFTKTSKARVNEFAKVLAQTVDSWETIEIHGHSDSNSKNPARNQELSELRAKAVQKIFVEAGVADDRLKSFGHGADQPLPGIDPKDGENRRVELALFGAKNAQELQEKLSSFIVPN